MKKCIFLALALLSACHFFAQSSAPQFFNYQAVPRKPDGSLFVAGKVLKVRFQIRENTANGVIRYAEDQTIQINQQGAFSAVIGKGNQVPNQPHHMANVSWGDYPYFLAVSVDINGNGSFENDENFGTSQLVSVPYALYAETSGSSIPGPQGPPGPKGDKGDKGEKGDPGPNGIGGSGNAGYLPRFANTTTLANSDIYELSGRIGIGTTTPVNGSKLHVVGGTKLEGSLLLNNVALNGVGAELITSASSFRPSAAIGQDLGTGSYRWDLWANNLDVAGILNFPGSRTIEVATGQGLSVNASLNPKYDKQRYLGNSSLRWTQVWAANGTIQTSDATLKRNIQPLSYGLKDLLKIRPVSYYWNDGHDSEFRHIGFIAQELQTVLPEVIYDKEWVITNEATGAGEWRPATRLGVAYSEIIPVTVAAIQEQQAQIEAQQKQIEALKGELEAIRQILREKR